MDLELFQLLKSLGGSAPGMDNWQPTPTDLTNSTQQNARPYVGVKPAAAPEGTAPRTLPKSYPNPRVFEAQGSNLRQIGGPLMGLMLTILPSLFGHNPWEGVMDLDAQLRHRQLWGPNPLSTRQPSPGDFEA